MSKGLFAAEAGTGGPVLVLLHGFGGSHHVWTPVMEAHSHRCRVLAYDLPAHGHSFDYPGGGPVRVAVDAVLADLGERGIDRFHLAGHSMGGAISTLMALKAPERIASLTLLAPGGFGPEINMRLLTRYAGATDADTIRACLEAMTGFANSVNDAAVADLLEGRQRVGQREKLLQIAATMTRNGVQGAIPRDAMAGLPMPVKVLWGMQDAVLPVTQADGLPPFFGVHRFPSAGHMLVEEETASVIRLLGESVPT